MSDISPQLRFGGGDGMHVSGYEESQSPLSCIVSIGMLEKKTIDAKLRNNILVDIKAITLLLLSL